MRKLLNRKGFTIIEVIVTLAVLGIVIGPLMTMFITSQKINNEGSKEYQSIQLAQKYMEEIKGMESVNDLILYDKPGRYNYTSNAGVFNIKSEPEEESPFFVSVEIKPMSDNSVINNDIDYGETITIMDNTCGGTKFPEFIYDKKSLNITVNNDKMIINKAEFNLASAIVKIKLESNVTLNFIDSERVAELYIDNYDNIHDKTYKCSINVYGGKTPKISYIDDDAVAKNILYEITIKVDNKPIDTNSKPTIKSTKIFK